MTFKLPQKIEYVLGKLISNGHKAYIVGGCVRDLICGKEPHDYDITTSALPQETQTIFNKTVATGLKHGTVTVITNGEAIEVTTFRTEGVYNDSRHPENVNFVHDVKEDLSRRDFTVNAMCYNHQEGLIDLFGGKNDINSKILKAVGNAETRFSEDALRILRLFRFAATLNFTIDKQTFDAAIKHAPLLKNISAERIFTELQKTASGQNISVITPLLNTNVLDNYCFKNADLSGISNLNEKQDLRTFALLNIASNNLPQTLDALKCSNSFKDYCLKMNYLTTSIIKNNKISIKKALNFANIDIVFDTLCYYRDILNIDTSNHKLILDEILNGREPYKTSHLAITGSDVIGLGFDGKQVGDKLEFLLNEVIKNPSLNTRQKLLNLICN